MVKTRSGKSTTPQPPLIAIDVIPPNHPVDQVNEDVLCDIEDPILFQTMLTRWASRMDWDEWDVIASTLMSLSPRSFIVGLAAHGFYDLESLDEKRLFWMLRGPNPYILNHPTMMHEVRALNLHVSADEDLQFFPSLHHFTSLRKLCWNWKSSLPDDAFSLLRQHVTGLKYLHLQTPRITAPMFNDIVQLTNLESLELVFTYTTAIPPLGNLQGLKELEIWDWGRGRESRSPCIILPSTLEGLTRIEILELSVRISDDLAMSMHVMFPMLKGLRVYQDGLNANAIASLKSHYKKENLDGFMLRI